MATKYVCDGCDKEFPTKYNNISEVTVTFDRERDTYSESPPKEMDLCRNCLNSFKQSIDNLLRTRNVSAKGGDI